MEQVSQRRISFLSAIDFNWGLFESVRGVVFRDVPAGKNIVEQNVLNDCVFRLVDGSCGLDLDGKRHGVVNWHDEWPAFCEESSISILPAVRTTYSVIALTDCHVQVIPSSVFLSVLFSESEKKNKYQNGRLLYEWFCRKYCLKLHSLSCVSEGIPQTGMEMECLTINRESIIYSQPCALDDGEIEDFIFCLSESYLGIYEMEDFTNSIILEIKNIGSLSVSKRRFRLTTIHQAHLEIFLHEKIPSSLITALYDPKQKSKKKIQQENVNRKGGQRGLTENEFHTMLKKGKSKSYKSGAEVIPKGAQMSGLMYVAKGTCSQFLPTLREKIFCEDTFLDANFFFIKKPTAYSTVAEKGGCTVIFIPIQVILEMGITNPIFFCHLYQTLAARLSNILSGLSQKEEHFQRERMLRARSATTDTRESPRKRKRQSTLFLAKKLKLTKIKTISLNEKEPLSLLSLKEKILVSYKNGSLDVWEASGILSKDIQLAKQPLLSLIKGEDLVVCVGEDGTLYPVDQRDWSLLPSVKDPGQGSVQATCIVPLIPKERESGSKELVERKKKKRTYFWIASVSGVLSLWGIEGKEVKIINHFDVQRRPFAIETISFSTSFLLALGGKGTLSIFDCSPEKEENFLSLSESPSFEDLSCHNGEKIQKLLFSSSTNRLWSGSVDGVICVWEVKDIPSLSLVQTLQGVHKSKVMDMCLVGDYVCSVSSDQLFCIWDMKKLVCLQQSAGHSALISSVVSIVGGEDDLLLCTISFDETMCFWEREGRAKFSPSHLVLSKNPLLQTNRIQLNTNAEPQCLLTLPSDHIAIGFSTGGIEIRNKKGELITSFHSEKRIYCLLKIGDVVIGVIEDGSLIFFQILGWELLRIIKSQHQETVRSAVKITHIDETNVSQRYLWTADVAGRIIIWHVQGTSIVKTQQIEIKRPILSMEAIEIEDNLYVVLGCPRGELLLLPASSITRTTTSPRSLDLSSSAVSVAKNSNKGQDIRRLLFVPRCKQVWSAGLDGGISVWNVFKDGAWSIHFTFSAHEDRVMDLCLVGATVVCSVSFDKCLIIWDAVNHVKLQQFMGHENHIVCVCSGSITTSSPSPFLSSSSFLGLNPIEYTVWSASLDSSVCLYEMSQDADSTSSGSPLKKPTILTTISLPLMAEPQCLLATNDKVVVGDSTGGVDIHTFSGEKITHISTAFRVYKIINFGELFVFVLEDGSLIPYSTKEGESPKVQSSHRQLVRAAVSVPSDKVREFGVFWTADVTGLVIVWLLKKSSVQKMAEIQTRFPVLCLECLVEGGAVFLVLGCPGGCICLLPIRKNYFFYRKGGEEGEEKNDVEVVIKDAHQMKDIRKLLVVPFQRQVWSASLDGEILVWEYFLEKREEKEGGSEKGGERERERERLNWKLKSSLKKHNDRVMDLCLCNQNSFVCSVSFDTVCVVWDAARLSCLYVLEHPSSVTCVGSGSPTNSFMVWTACADGKMFLWQSEIGQKEEEERKEEREKDGKMERSAFSRRFSILPKFQKKSLDGPSTNTADSQEMSDPPPDASIRVVTAEMGPVGFLQYQFDPKLNQKHRFREKFSRKFTQRKENFEAPDFTPSSEQREEKNQSLPTKYENYLSRLRKDDPFHHFLLSLSEDEREDRYLLVGGESSSGIYEKIGNSVSAMVDLLIMRKTLSKSSLQVMKEYNACVSTNTLGVSSMNMTMTDEDETDSSSSTDSGPSFYLQVPPATPANKSPSSKNKTRGRSPSFSSTLQTLARSRPRSRSRTKAPLSPISSPISVPISPLSPPLSPPTVPLSASFCGSLPQLSPKNKTVVVLVEHTKRSSSLTERSPIGRRREREREGEKESQKEEAEEEINELALPSPMKMNLLMPTQKNKVKRVETTPLVAFESEWDEPQDAELDLVLQKTITKNELGKKLTLVRKGASVPLLGRIPISGDLGGRGITTFPGPSSFSRMSSLELRAKEKKERVWRERERDREIQRKKEEREKRERDENSDEEEEHGGEEKSPKEEEKEEEEEEEEEKDGKEEEKKEEKQEGEEEKKQEKKGEEEKEEKEDKNKKKEKEKSDHEKAKKEKKRDRKKEKKRKGGSKKRSTTIIPPPSSSPSIPKDSLIVNFKNPQTAKIIAPVGGSGAAVYNCDVSGFQCVMKECSISNTDRQTLNKFRTEIAILSSFSHPNICKYLHHTEKRGFLRLFLTKYETSLRSEVQQRGMDVRDGLEDPFSALEILSLMLDIAKGLKYIHSHNYIHRDLKSDNIFLKYGERGEISSAVIGDFDSAKKLESGPSELSRSITGTTNYITPQIMRMILEPSVKCPYSAKADIWSFAMVTYEILTLQLPYGNLQVTQAVLLIKQGIRPPVPPSDEGLPDADSLELYSSVLELFEKCSVFDEHERPSAVELNQIIHRKLHSL